MEPEAQAAAATAASALAAPAAPAVALELVPAADFEAMRAQMQAEDDLREQLIKKSREVLKLSKNSIYALHRGEVARANEMVAQAKEQAKRDLLPLLAGHPQLRHGALSSALEEWAEAAMFCAFLATGRLPSMAELEIVTKEEYLGGVMDFTGELNRHAVLRATARDAEGVRRCRDVVDVLFSQLMLFDWRNGNLRRKFDAVKYTLKKLETIIYELSLVAQGAVVVPKSSGMDAEQPPAAEGGSGEDGGDDGSGQHDGGREGGGDAGREGGGSGGRGGRGGFGGAKRGRVQ